jgi:hypothetical protein
MTMRFGNLFAGAGLLAVLAATVGATPAAAQARALEVHLTPTLGWYTPIQNLATVPDDSQSVWSRVEPAPVLGLAAEAGLRSVPFLGARIGVRYAPSELALRRFDGFQSCGQDCGRARYTSEPLAPASLLLVTGDLLLRGPRMAAVQPYLAAGGGLKRYDFRQQELEGEAATVFAQDETRRTLHLGLGLDTRWKHYSLVTELGSHLSSFGEEVPSLIHPERMDPGERQLDLFLSVGLRVRAF